MKRNSRIIISCILSLILLCGLFTIGAAASDATAAQGIDPGILVVEIVLGVGLIIYIAISVSKNIKRKKANEQAEEKPDKKKNGDDTL